MPVHGERRRWEIKRRSGEDDLACRLELVRETGQHGAERIGSLHHECRGEGVGHGEYEPALKTELLEALVDNAEAVKAQWISGQSVRANGGMA